MDFTVYREDLLLPVQPRYRRPIANVWCPRPEWLRCRVDRQAVSMHWPKGARPFYPDRLQQHAAIKELVGQDVAH